ncbi:MAG TPA: dTDP-4-dehydrorhamnose reductase [Acidimicrobiales bacterium]|nr:dTDP-4-dehydrorhamnose reductase [Acidimicrobiales bacterium]
MRVLVTGAQGQVGRELLGVFDDVVGAGRGLDVGVRDQVFQAVSAVQPDVIVHAAAWTDVDGCEGDPDRALRANAVGTRHVAQAARLVGARVCYLSTDYVFRGDLDRPYHEWDEPDPLSVYGRSKLAGERELSAEDLIVRTSWVFGRHGRNVVKTVLRLAAASTEELGFVDDQRGCPTSAADLAAGVRTLVEGRAAGTYHVTNQGAVTWFEFAQDVLRLAGEDAERVRPIKSADLARPAPRPANSVLDNAALRLTGLPLLPDYRQSLQQLVQQLTKEGLQ